MQVDWRGLLTEARIPWKDRGPNTSKNNVNVCCPWCGNDESYHLAISLTRPAFYCFRRPEHSGGDIMAMLVKLGIPRYAGFELINRFEGRTGAAVELPPKPASMQNKIWEAFSPLADWDEGLDYLFGRGIDNPEGIAARYDLRFAIRGDKKWRNRVLLPIKREGEVVSWTGCAVRANMIPKYMTEDDHRKGLVYLPRSCRQALFIVEGPLDALKLAVASEAMPVAAAALLGKQLNDSRLANIEAIAREAEAIYLCLDADTALHERMRMLAELRMLFRNKPVRAVKLPPGIKDPGQLELSSARRWIKDCLAAEAMV